MKQRWYELSNRARWEVYGFFLVGFSMLAAVGLGALFDFFGATPSLEASSA